MPFFYDQITEKSGFVQYSNYLDNEIYLSDLRRDTKDIVNYQLIEVRRALGKDSEQSLKSFDKLTNDVCGTLETGFNKVGYELSGIKNELTDIKGELSDINWRLNDINEGIGNLHAMLDWKTDLLIEGQKITNLYLGKVIKMLKIPDSQKQRGYHVEQGLTYLKNAIMEGAKSDFYSDALDEFLKAKKIEEKDYFCLHKLGLIYLNSKAHLDVKKADEYFRLSARYAKAAVNASIESSDSDQKSKERQLWEETASALMFASKANYILNDLPESIKLAQQAIDANLLNLDYKIHLAKCLSANGQEQEALAIILDVIKKDANYSVKILTDFDFVSKSIIVDGLEKLTKELIERINAEMNYLNSIIIMHTTSYYQFVKLQQLSAENTYIIARKIEFELSKEQPWTYTHYNNEFFDKNNYEFPLQQPKSINTSLSQIIRIESQEEKNKKTYQINLSIAANLNAAKTKKKEQQILLKKLFLIILTIVISVLIWNYASSMDGWFFAGIIKIIVVISALIAGVIIFNNEKNH